MKKTTIGDLKQELIDTIKGIDKDKVTIFDLKTLAEIISILAGIKEKQLDYMDILSCACDTRFGYKPTIISDLKGDK